MLVFGMKDLQLHLAKIPEYVGSVKYLELLNEINLKESGKPFVDEATLLNYKYQTDPDLYPDINWWDEIAKKCYKLKSES